jgi:hypothetical protein
MITIKWSFSQQVILGTALAGLILSCSPLHLWGLAQGTTTIGSISADAGDRRRVFIQGQVVNVAPFLVGGAYQIQDATGRIWVRSQGALPKKGASLSVQGEITAEAIFVGPEKLAESYIKEISQELIATQAPPLPPAQSQPIPVETPPPQNIQPLAQPLPGKPSTPIDVNGEFLPHKQLAKPPS